MNKAESDLIIPEENFVMLPFIELEEAKLKDKEAQFLINKFLGFTFHDSYTIDTKLTLENLIQNIDKNGLKHPARLLAFKNIVI